MTPRNDTSDQSAGGSREAVATVRERFEAYVSDLRTTLEHAARAGTASERVRSEADRLVQEYRQRLRDADDYAAAERWFERFRAEAERLRT